MKRALFVILGAVLVGLFCTTAEYAQKLKPQEVVAKHLASIGTPEARAAAKTRMAIGSALVRFISQKNQTAEGRIVMASEGDKNFLGLTLNAIDYPREKFTFNGSKADVATATNGQRSFLGNFVSSNDVMLKGSLMGGVLSSSWALANDGETKAKISFEGTKKVDGRESYVLGYSPKGGSDLDINLYFDKETFRHVQTEYKRTSSAGIGVTPDQSSGFSETRLKVTESYSDFKEVSGLTLPHTYKLLYSISGQRGTVEVEWVYNLNEFSFNQKLEEKTFDPEVR